MSLGCPTLTTEHAHAIVASSREHNTPVVRGRSVWLLVRLPGRPRVRPDAPPPHTRVSRTRLKTLYARAALAPLVVQVPEPSVREVSTLRYDLLSRLSVLVPGHKPGIKGRLPRARRQAAVLSSLSSPPAVARGSCRARRLGVGVGRDDVVYLEDHLHHLRGEEQLLLLAYQRLKHLLLHHVVGAVVVAVDPQVGVLLLCRVIRRTRGSTRQPAPLSFRSIALRRAADDKAPHSHTPGAKSFVRANSRALGRDLSRAAAP
eukprot:1195797-Prorocentrum_minimum.AAC.13